MHHTASYSNKAQHTLPFRQDDSTGIRLGQPNDSYEKEADAIADQVVMRPDMSEANSGMTGNNPSPFQVQPSKQTKQLQMNNGQEHAQMGANPATLLQMNGNVHTDGILNNGSSVSVPFIQKNCEACEQEEEVQLKPCSRRFKMVAGGTSDDESTEHVIPGPIMKANTENGVQMKCKACEKRDQVQMKPVSSADSIQFKPAGGFSKDALVKERSRPSSLSAALSGRIKHAAGGGQPLNPRVNAEMSQRIGADFSQVRIHTDSRAVQFNQALGARAFTYGRDIFFSRGAYNPFSVAGKHLLAHELVHTVQQGKSRRLLIQRKDDPRLSKESIDAAHGAIKIVFGPRFKAKDLTLGTEEWAQALEEEHKAHWKNVLMRIFKAKELGYITTSQKSELQGILYGLSKLIAKTFRTTTLPKEFELLRSKVAVLQPQVKEWAKDPAACDSIKDMDGTVTTKCDEIKEVVSNYPDLILKEMGKKSTFNYMLSAAEYKKDVEKNLAQLTLLVTGKQHSIKEGDFLGNLKVSTVNIEIPGTYHVYDIFKIILRLYYGFDLDKFNVMEEESSEAEAEATASAQKTLSALEEDILKANEIIASSSGGGQGISEDIVLNLTKKAQQNADGQDKLRGLNKTLADILSKNAGTLTEDQKRALEPIDINKIPLFNEMMMLEGLMAGAGQVSPEINAQTIELKGNIHKLRNFIISEILWLIGEISATSVIGALLAPVSLGASAIIAGGRAAMLIYRLNKLKELLEKAQKVYAIYQNVSQAIDSIGKGFGTFKKFKAFKDEFEQKKEEIDILYDLLETTPSKADEIAEAEANLINDVITKLESGELNDLLKYLRLPEGLKGEELADEMERIIMNIPTGIEAFHHLKTHYEAGRHKKADLDFATELAVKGVIAGAALYPLVGYIVEKVNEALIDLMNQEGLLERFSGLFTSFGTRPKKKRKRTRTDPKKKLAAARRGDAKKDKERIKRKQEYKQERSAFKKYDYNNKASLTKYLVKYDLQFEEYLDKKENTDANGFWTPLYFVYKVKDLYKNYLKQTRSEKVTAKRKKDEKEVHNAPAPPFKIIKLNPKYNSSSSFSFWLEVNPKVQVTLKKMKDLRPSHLTSNHLPFNLSNKDTDNVRKVQSIKEWLEAYNYTLVPANSGVVQIRLMDKRTGTYLRINASYQIVGSNDINHTDYRAFIGKLINSSDDLPEGYYLDSPDIKHKEAGKDWVELGLDGDDKLILTGDDENDKLWKKILTQTKKSCTDWQAVTDGMTKEELASKVESQGLKSAYKGLKVDISKGGERRPCHWIITYEWNSKKYICQVRIKKIETQKHWEDLKVELKQLSDSIKKDFEKPGDKKGIAKSNLEKKVVSVKNKAPYLNSVSAGVVINGISKNPAYQEMFVKRLCFSDTSDKYVFLVNEDQRYKYLKDEIKLQFNGWRLSDKSTDRKKIRQDIEEGIEVLLLELELPATTVIIENSTSPDGWRIKGKSPKASKHKDEIFLVPGNYWGSQSNPVEFKNWPKPSIEGYPEVYIGPEVNNSDQKDVQIIQEDLKNFRSKSATDKQTLVNQWKAAAINQKFKDNIDDWFASPTILVFQPTKREALPGTSGKTIGVIEKFQVRKNKKLELKDHGASTPGGTLINKELKRYGYDPSHQKQDGDHVWEYQLGGPDSLENLWPLDESSNSSAGSTINNKDDFYDPSDTSVKDISVSDLKAIKKSESKEIWFIIKSFK